VVENRELRRIFRPKKEKVARRWRKLHDEKLNNLNSSSNVIDVIKLRRPRWVGYVARIGQLRMRLENLNGRDHLEYIDVHGGAGG
jgi:hypothetical protein